MNILYLQGLDSNLSDEKKFILEPFGNIIAPNLDYKSNSNMIEILNAKYKSQNINFIIGSSMVVLQVFNFPKYCKFLRCYLILLCLIVLLFCKTSHY